MHIMRVRDGIILLDGSCGTRCICGPCIERLDKEFAAELDWHWRLCLPLQGR